MECLAASQLAHLLSSAATPELALHIDAHVDACSACRQLLLRVVQVITLPPASLASTQDCTGASLSGSASPGAPEPTMISRRYRILSSLGEGGMGRVYRAYDRLSQAEVALKQVLLPPPPLAWSSSTLASDILAASRTSGATIPPGGSLAARRIAPSAEPAERRSRLATLVDEFCTLATLRHPHIVSVLDYGFDAAGHPFYTMELLPAAQPLLQLGKACSRQQQAELLLQLLDALAYLHRRGILHRDLSPNNVLGVMGAAGPEVKVVDFGLALIEQHGAELALAGTVKRDRVQRRDGLQQTGSFYAANRAVSSVTALLGGAAT